MTKKRCLSGLLAVSLLLSVFLVFPLSTSAAGEETDILGQVTDKTISHYEELTVKLGRAKLAMKGVYILGTPYLPLYEFCDAFTECKLTASSGTYTLTATGLQATVTNGQYYMEVNGRYFYRITPAVVMSDGVLYVPMVSAAKTVGVSASFDASSRIITVTGQYKAPLSGSLYYQADAVYWLSRIISAESRGEPLLGQIAVGCVVLNRTRSASFPNTIWGVIFDREGGVQFAPVSNGSIYAEPYAASVIAAKICLEGYSVSADVLFFYEPTAATSSWIENSRPYLFTIGHHRFFG